VPRKNILPLAGKPLIAYTIETALASKRINRVIVSTDDEEIAAIAKQHGAEVPFLRPKELAEDMTPDLPVFQHAVEWLAENEQYRPDLVVHLWATAPFRKVEDIDQAIDMLIADPGAHSVRGVTKPPMSPFRMWRRDKGPYLSYLLHKEFPEFYKDRIDPQQGPRQGLPETVAQTEYLAVIRRETIEAGSYTGENVLPFYHDPDTYVEINIPRDVKEVEELMRKRQEGAS